MISILVIFAYNLNMSSSKRKILNDPVHGFINIPSGLLFNIVEHKYFQRLRRITQLGLTNFVYPGANHTRFQHALGATYLMSVAIDVIRLKGHEITEHEAESVLAAILLHDIGHGPFSHALENSIVKNISHETISDIIIGKLNAEFDNKLSTALDIFKNKYHKKFLHQLVSGQLDVDRLDYLKRDSFFTGVSEGVIGSDRIIKMLNVVDDKLVVEAKGIYSIEKFLIARRLMYWQVYLHKTVLSAEQLLVKILKRAKEISLNGNNIFAPDSLKYFLKNNINKNNFSDESLNNFIDLDDNDIISAIKVWTKSNDKVLSELSNRLINRRLLKIEIQNQDFTDDYINKIKDKTKKILNLTDNQVNYFVFKNNITNNAYSANDDRINILLKSGKLKDIAESSDILNISVLSKTIKKYYLCYPKEV